MLNLKEYINIEEIDGRTQATLIADEALIYIPTDYFKNSKFAEIQSVLCETIGVFYFRVKGELRLLKMPIKIHFQYTGVPEKESLILKPGQKLISYTIFKLVKGCAFIYDLYKELSMSDTLFVTTNYLEDGKYPPFMNYNDLVDMIFKAYSACNQSTTFLNVPSLIIETMLANSCRWSKDSSKPMRLAYNGKNPYDFNVLRLKVATSTLSTINAIMGENLTKQLVAGVYRTRNGIEEPENEIEKIMKY